MISTISGKSFLTKGSPPVMLTTDLSLRFDPEYEKISRRFLEDPDASLKSPDTRYLKQGNTCTLWLTRVDGRQLVVKRYNIKGLVHRFGRAFRRMTPIGSPVSSQ